jgi:DNA-binding IclR family transcriptional regulator
MTAVAVEKDKDERRSSLGKGLALLSVIAGCGRAGATLSDAARRARLHPATAHRLLSALLESNFVSLDPYRKRYHLGLMPYEIVSKAGPDPAFVELRRRMRPTLRAVQAELDGIVCLSVPSNGEALCIEVLPGNCVITVNTLEVGSRRPLGAGAASLALLAALPAAERDAVIAREEERYRKYGGLSAEIVREACVRLERDGYVVNEGVIIPDIVALAVPIFDGADAIAAMSVTNTVSQLAKPRRREMLGVMAAAIGRLGYGVRPQR